MNFFSRISNSVSISVASILILGICTGKSSKSFAAQSTVLTDTGMLSLPWYAGLAVLFCAIAVGLLLIKARRTHHRLSEMTNAMTRLAEGDLQIAIPFAGKRDLFGTIAAVVKVFQEQARERARLEAMVEDDRARERLHQQHHDAMISGFQALLSPALAGVAAEIGKMTGSSDRLYDVAANANARINAGLAAASEAAANIDDAASKTGKLNRSFRKIATKSQELSKPGSVTAADPMHTIANAIAEQKAAAQDIAQSMALAAAGSQRTTGVIRETSKIIATISAEAENSVSVAARLYQISDELSSSVQKFAKGFSDDVKERRRAARYSVRIPLSVTAAGRTFVAEALDISQLGLQIRLADPLPKGTTVAVSMPKMPHIRGKVMWTREGLNGIAFPSEVSIEQLVCDYGTALSPQ